MSVVLSHDGTNVYVNDDGNLITIPKASVTLVESINGYIRILYPPHQTLIEYSHITAPTTSSIGNMVSVIQSWVNSYFVTPSSNNYFASGW